MLPRRGRHAASNYEVLETLAGGAAALVRWRLETGRTHQIRVHAKHIGHPLLADETYGNASTALSMIGKTNGPRYVSAGVRPGVMLIPCGCAHVDHLLPGTTQPAVQWI